MISFEHLTKRYGEATVVDDISFTVPSRTVTAIVGASGSGKSTLLRMVNRLVTPSSGQVCIDGEDIARIQPYMLRRRIGYTIQNYGLFPHYTVAENVATVPRLLGWPPARIEAKVDELLTLFRLDPGEFRNRFPHQLSGGQQQRVGVARALAAEPNILLMDEPFGALDPIIREKAQDDLKAIQSRFGTTLLLVTHDMEEAIRLADHIAVMEGGRLEQYAPPGEMLLHPATPLVEQLIGTSDKAFRVLSLVTLEAAAAPGPPPPGALPLPASLSLREALSELLWSRRNALAVIGEDGAPKGSVTLEAILRRAAGPEASQDGPAAERR